MAVCRNCGADDLYKSDLCGDYCVYCLNLEEINDKAIQKVGKKDDKSF